MSFNLILKLEETPTGHSLPMVLRRHFHRTVHLRRPPWEPNVMFYPVFVLDGKEMVFITF